MLEYKNINYMVVTQDLAVAEEQRNGKLCLNVKLGHICA